MGIDVTSSTNSLQRLFTFPYQDDRVKVWGELYECCYHGPLKDVKLQEEEVEEVLRMSLQELYDLIEASPEKFMPDAVHCMRLYRQWQGDVLVSRRLLKGYSSGDLDQYGLRPKPLALFFDCDDCLYFDGWKTANLLTQKIDEWCCSHGLQPGQAYELYKQYGTALRGLLAEGYLEDSPEAIDAFLLDVHDIPIHSLLQRDDELREMLLALDPSIPKYIFTASVSHHAMRCLTALGIQDMFVDVIDCKLCDFESKHAKHSFQVAMKVAGVQDPERCLFFDGEYMTYICYCLSFWKVAHSSPDNTKNIHAARQVGWRCVLVGKIGRDCGTTITSEHAELEVEQIHDIPRVLPELFPDQKSAHSTI
jgi:putative hydrolase of the HAD superfamily/pyrimidine and pyridine-specific 5'-nucleotidase